MFDIYDNKFTVKGRSYIWSEIEDIKVFDGSVARSALIPVAAITMRDGFKVKVSSPSFAKNKVRPRTGFFSSMTDSFVEFVNMMEEMSGGHCEWGILTYSRDDANAFWRKWHC